MKTKISLLTITLIVLASVVWFAPDRPIQLVKALHLVVQSIGPGAMPVDKPSSSEIEEGLLDKVKSLL